jgi:GT2 family glycosyltransferase
MDISVAVAYPTVEVVIPHYRDAGRLERCLDSLSKTRYRPLGILVVDNGSGKPELEKLVSRFPGVRLLSLPANRGYAGGCNAGAGASGSEYLVFMNDDTRHEPGWLEELVSAAQRDRRIAALQPKILSLPEHEKGRQVFDHAGAAGGMIDRLGYPWCYGRNFSGVEADNGQYNQPKELFWASGAAMLVRRDVFESLGGFDDSFFMHMEEIDLCWRMRLAGYRVMSAPSSVVWHEGGASLAQGSPEKIYYNHRNNLLMLLKNMSLSSLVAVLPVRLFLEGGSALFYLFKGPDGISCSLSVLRALRDVLLRLPETLDGRKLVQALRKKGDRALFSGLPFSVFFRR